ncbi:sigma-54-dependent Fis family transcriptional regulator [Azohydromonas aeria]|uniref:sigma-54-dependent Fis family transcriptional regulator n=1 Tax=Azohydromonas aeria TaxID=2590212 RepID=UPI00287333B5|nr:sigma-54-dependent Fis family transcriptional regulator [Azohydromonas aeria]
MSDLLDSARLEMSTLYQQLADAETAVVLTDADGVILHVASSPEFAREAESVGLTVGAVWTEAVAGTNGMGTCLALAEPVSVRREEHFFAHLSSLTCSAVPVHDPGGRLVAVLDVTSRSALQQQHVLVLLGMTARMIENRLIDRRFPGSHSLHFHTRPEFVHTLHEGRLALDRQGRILAANRSALFQLGVESAQALCGRTLGDVFQTSLADLLERCRAASFHPVPAYRLHGAHRFFALLRPPVDAVAPGSPPAAPALAIARSAPPAGAVGADPQLARQLHMACRVVARGTPVLLRGESGAGKEVFARAVHAAGSRAQGSFVAVNCASIPESLIEAELFGYRAGAFTGAQKSGRRGKILQADGGTLFLDEIGDMPLLLQARLLRVLDERRVSPLGTEESQRVDFQLLSASHRNLLDLVAHGQFREDLYYRLAGVELHLPALRERADKRDLILRVLEEENGGPAPLTRRAERLLLGHAWPGNVRQLRHALRAAVALADGQPIDVEHLPMLRPAELPAAPRPTQPETRLEAKAGKLNPLQVHERQALLQLLQQHRWNISLVARTLDLSRNTLYRKLHRLQIPVSQRD